MEVANTLAYYDTATITAVKCFIVQAPGFKPLNLSAVATDANAAALHYENFVEDFIFR
jgi:hypothetical protein